MPDWAEKVFIISKIKNTVPWIYRYILLMISMVKKLLEHFMKKNCKRLIKNNLEYKKYLRKKVIYYMLNGKVMTIHLIAGLIKKI